MLIGVSHCPWEADQKLLPQVYQKYLRIPKPDYSTRYAVWHRLLGQYKAIGWQFDISAMSKISDGFTIGMYFIQSLLLQTFKLEWTVLSKQF